MRVQGDRTPSIISIVETLFPESGLTFRTSLESVGSSFPGSGTKIQFFDNTFLSQETGF